MKKTTFRKARIASFFTGIFYIGGYLWFSDSYLSQFSIFNFFTMSTGIALFIIPLISDGLIENIVIRIFALLIGIFGILNIFYMMIDDLEYAHIVDTIADLLVHMVVLFILGLMLYRVFNPKGTKD